LGFNKNKRILTEYARDTLPGKLTEISYQASPSSLLGASAGIFQRPLADESGMIKTQMGTHNRSENGGSAWDALYDTTP
jgi:hypothetical protein